VKSMGPKIAPYKTLGASWGRSFGPEELRIKLRRISGLLFKGFTIFSLGIFQKNVFGCVRKFKNEDLGLKISQKWYSLEDCEKYGTKDSTLRNTRC
jgi:hypothetical protein